MPIELMDVGQAASRLGVSSGRVRQLIDDGSIAGQQLAGRWFLDPLEVERFGRRGRSGRPYAPSVAWRVLAALDPDLLVPPPDDRAQAIRIRRYAAEVGHGHVGGLRARSEVVRYRVHRGLHSRVASRLLVTGPQILGDVGGDRIAGDDDVLHGYIRRREAGRLESSYKLRRAGAPGDDPNLLLHVVDDHLWPFPQNAPSVGPIVAAVDLLDDARDERAMRAARNVLNRRANRLDQPGESA